MSVIGPVTLTVADLPSAVAFYRERIGFRVHADERGRARLGAGVDDLLVLVEDKGAVRAPSATGLFHFAILLPSRQALARSLAQLARTRTPLQGAADHLVSEALYLADPEGNGIELYRDRPRESWRWEAGQLAMTTEPLDVEAILSEGEADRAAWEGLPRETIIGHIHLRVAHIPPAERFYCDLLGFRLTARYGSAASFVSTAGYHHHIAFNTWLGVGAPSPPANASGLKEFVVRLGGREALDRALTRLRGAKLSVDAGTIVRDPSGNAVRLVDA